MNVNDNLSLHDMWSGRCCGLCTMKKGSLSLQNIGIPLPDYIASVSNTIIGMPCKYITKFGTGFIRTVKRVLL